MKVGRRGAICSRCRAPINVVALRIRADGTRDRSIVSLARTRATNFRGDLVLFQLSAER